MATDLGLVMHGRPALTRTNFRSMARAIDWPSEVLPTPGGPTKHRIGALPFGASLRTARNSMMRCLILSRPKWSWSRIRRASAMSIGFSSGSFQGSSTSQSR